MNRRAIFLALLAGLVPAAARANGGSGIAVDGQGRVYFVDAQRHVLWRVDRDGHRTALARDLKATFVTVTPDGTAYLPTDDFTNSFRWRITIVRPDGTTRDSVLATDIAVKGGHTVGMDSLGVYAEREKELSRTSLSGVIRALLYAMNHTDITAAAPLPDGRIAVLTGNMLRRSEADTLGGDIVGDSLPGLADLGRTSARFDHPVALAVASVNDIYVADAGNRRLRHVDINGTVTTSLITWWPWRPVGVTARGDTAWVVEQALPAGTPGWIAGVLGSPRVQRVVGGGSVSTVASTPSWGGRVLVGVVVGLGVAALDRKRRERRGASRVTPA